MGSFASAAATSNSSPIVKNADSSELLSLLKKPTVSKPEPVPVPTAGGFPSDPVSAASFVPIATANSFESIPRPAPACDLSLTGLVASLKACPTDRNIFGIGLDLESAALGLPFAQPEPLSQQLWSPWFDEDLRERPEGESPRDKSPSEAQQSSFLGLKGTDTNAPQGPSAHSFPAPPTGSAQRPVTPPQAGPNASTAARRRPSTLDSLLPNCYYQQPVPSAASKIASFADETLFYIFYAMPGDRMQLLAARELVRRNWRFHKILKSWIAPIPIAPQNDASSPPLLMGNVAVHLFDQAAWIKIKRQMVLRPGEVVDDKDDPVLASASVESVSDPSSPRTLPHLGSSNIPTASH